MNIESRKHIARVCILSLFLATSLSPVHAAMLPTAAVIDAAVGKTTSITARDQVKAYVAREDVRSQFLSMGVAAEDIDARVAALSDNEVRALSEQLASAPAGGGALGLIGAVFVVLLVLELLGITNFFTTIDPAR